MRDGTSADKRERILEAVLAVLARDGISGVTMRAVAREAGVALGLATYHFEDKDSLVEPTPGAEPGEVERRANETLIVQNWAWLTSVLVPDPDTVTGSVARTEAIAFDDGPDSAATRSA